jgi:hypothetical protein
MKQHTVKSIRYSLIVDPNDGNIYNSAQVNNKKDFPYPQSKGQPNPLTDRLGLYKSTSESTKEAFWYFNDSATDQQFSLFKSRNDLNFTEVAARLDGSLPFSTC